MTWWIAAWFSGAATLLTPATYQYSVPQAMNELRFQYNSFDVMTSTMEVSKYMLHLTEPMIGHQAGWHKRVFKVKEKNLKYKNGVPYLSTKTGTKVQWAVASKSLELSPLIITNTTNSVINSGQHYTLSTSSNALLAYIVKRSSVTGNACLVYEGNEYLAVENYEIKFILKPNARVP